MKITVTFKYFVYSAIYDCNMDQLQPLNFEETKNFVYCKQNSHFVV